MRALLRKAADFLKSVAWIVAFMVLVLPALSKLGAQGKLPPIVVPQSWGKWNDSLPPMAEYSQPFFYEGWWKEIGACEHVIVPLELTRAVRFIYVNAKYMVVDGDRGVLGYADAPNRTIYIVLPLIYDKSVLMHEFLHVLDYWNGIDEGRTYHPPERFNACGIHTFYPNYNP